MLEGAAGSGKSTVVQAVMHYMSQGNGSHIAVASTGVAAIMIGRRTAHSFFRLSLDNQGSSASAKRAMMIL